MSDDLKVPRTDPLLPPGMSDRDTEPVPGDDADGTCPDCGAPLDEQNECPERACRAYRESHSDADSCGWGCTEACGWCGRCM